MKSTTPILCGTDFSGMARQAANTAAALAQRLAAPLWLAHVSSERAEHVSEGETLGNRLKAEAERLRKGGVAVEEKYIVGTPDEELAGLAEQSGARLVVVSSLGQRGAGRWLLGSVAERMAESSPVPTLVVRDAAPFEEWARHDRPLKIFVGADFTASSDAALRWVAELRQSGPCEIVVGYVGWPPEETARLGVAETLATTGKFPEALGVLERDLREKVTRLLGQDAAQVRVVGSWGRPEVPLVEMAVAAEADLVVVGTHQWHGLNRLRHGSVSRGVLRHAPMSVVCVPAPVATAVAGPRVRTCERVLVAVDLGAPHGFAAPYAYSIVQSGGTVRLVHAVAPVRSPDPTVGGTPQDTSGQREHARFIAECEAKLRALAPEADEARGITTEVEVIESSAPAEAICAAAERFGADIVCIGTHTRPGFTAKVLGSVSLAVLQCSRRPVLVVWPPAE